MNNSMGRVLQMTLQLAHANYNVSNSCFRCVGVTTQTSLTTAIHELTFVLDTYQNEILHVCELFGVSCLENTADMLISAYRTLHKVSNISLISNCAPHPPPLEGRVVHNRFQSTITAIGLDPEACLLNINIFFSLSQSMVSQSVSCARGLVARFYCRWI